MGRHPVERPIWSARSLCRSDPVGRPTTSLVIVIVRRLCESVRRETLASPEEVAMTDVIALSLHRGQWDHAGMSVGRALLVIADIGGYTPFMRLHRTSLAHAQDVVARLLEAMIDAAPQLTLLEVEGDAAFLYAWT